MGGGVGGGDNSVTKAFVENTAEEHLLGISFEASTRGNAL
jgi:hypothetical protein